MSYFYWWLNELFVSHWMSYLYLTEWAMCISLNELIGDWMSYLYLTEWATSSEDSMSYLYLLNELLLLETEWATCILLSYFYLIVSLLTYTVWPTEILWKQTSNVMKTSDASICIGMTLDSLPSLNNSLIFVSVVIRSTSSRLQTETVR